MPHFLYRATNTLRCSKELIQKQTVNSWTSATFPFGIIHQKLSFIYKRINKHISKYAWWKRIHVNKHHHDDDYTKDDQRKFFFLICCFCIFVGWAYIRPHYDMPVHRAIVLLWKFILSSLTFCFSLFFFLLLFFKSSKNFFTSLPYRHSFTISFLWILFFMEDMRMLF